MSLGFTPLGDRVVIQADIEDHAPVQTESGIVLAQTMAAAVDGSDTEDSWFVGTVVAVGPLVNAFNIRPYVLRRLKELCDDDRLDDMPVGLIEAFRADVQHLPTDCPDPLHVGDRVTFSWASGQQISLDGQKFLIMRASEVLAVLDKDEPNG